MHKRSMLERMEVLLKIHYIYMEGDLEIYDICLSCL
jgi:hypothetical protein